MTRDKIKKVLEEKRIKSRDAGTVELRTNCPFCLKDDKYHFYFNTLKNVGTCFRCNRSVHSLKEFIKYMTGGVVEETPESVKSWDQQKKTHVKKLLGMRDEVAKVVESVRLPEGSQSVILNYKKIFAGEVLYYLKSRGFNYSTMMLLNPFMCKTFPNWFILPVTMNGKIVYWIRRTLLRQEPKYMTPTSFKDGVKVMLSKGDVLWGYDLIKAGEPCILAEGILSAASIVQQDRVAVALLGKVLSDRQKELILNKNPSEIIICLDGKNEGDNTIEKSDKIYRQLSAHAQCKIVRLPERKDPNDLINGELLKYL